MRFAFPFERLLGIREFCYYPYLLIRPEQLHPQRLSKHHIESCQTSIIDYSNQKDGDIVEGICVIMYLNYLRPSNKPDKGNCTLRYIHIVNFCSRGRRGRDHMIVGFTTTCAICAYQH